MARIVDRTLSFPASGSPDVAGYKLYIVDEGGTLDYNSEVYDLGNVTSVTLNDIMSGKDGTFDIGVTAYDGVGNESDMSVINSVPLDFIPPDPPGTITIS